MESLSQRRNYKKALVVKFINIKLNFLIQTL